ncbi:TetR family transcriptional regulator [Mycobacterium intermedium]|uniref:TetR family transcriptional regulator n=1 Tax=Mycobacterium intermedium TaxID=28445 RepID=A0A1E3SIF0_MYCIE|nr:TetR/AcrR family transcriptional regulator [Mycobacterium intermedium]MCV6964429.1 TetR/AcrR family transcriptional regulator [Mycobacterium intermedium]ODR01909.1 transcriptional regulator [Mycobacterium intermedium]OPE49437.1 TetR family transcriptional regulator [Mycobacterium intermedium]ORB08638.1 TetR family transcriptional regulator [Mycobacterium intermedium]
MPGADWLVGGDRRAAAAERIYAAAASLIARDGINNLDIDKLAKAVHCSRATIYRHAGGKADIRNVVLARAAARIADSVRADVENLTGRERVVAAIRLSLRQIRADPLGQTIISAIRGGTREVAWFAESPLLADFATDLAGLDGADPLAAKWVVRTVLSLMYWPTEDDEVERRLVENFVAPAFAK